MLTSTGVTSAPFSERSDGSQQPADRRLLAADRGPRLYSFSNVKGNDR